MSDKEPVELQHNLEPTNFMWLWMKYVSGVNHQYHCTNCLRGKYGKLLSKHNLALTTTPTLNLDEQSSGSYAFIYICGVLKKGYPRTNYPHNLHAVIKPSAGSNDELQFENWNLGVTNGVFEPIPGELDLPPRYRSLPPEFTTCRIFRWAVCSTLNTDKQTNPE
jgi:hypothetical protein